MFDNFPKSRLPLPLDYQSIYEKHYKENREGASAASSLSQRLESWMHRKVAKDVRRNNKGLATLEIGAGTLNHLPYEPYAKPYDIVEPWSYLFEKSPFLGRVRKVYSGVEEIPLDSKYKRIISIAAFEHILNLPEVVARAGLLLDKYGQLRAAIPSEGTLLWKLGWKLTTGLEFRLRYALDYGMLMKHEHVNTSAEIEQILMFFFANVQCRFLGLHRKLSVYQFFICTSPNLDNCRSYLAQIGP